MSTPTISASQVKELRDQTGAGMMECKRALVEADGDLEEARRILRERGLAAAGKRAGRETTEGKVLAQIDGDVGTMVAVGCETEPVSKNDEFLAFARRVLDAVHESGEGAAEDLDTERLELIGKIGEKGRQILLENAERKGHGCADATLRQRRGAQHPCRTSGRR